MHTASPEMAWRCLWPKHRGRGQDCGHPNANLSPRTTCPKWYELNDPGPHSQPVFGGFWGDAHHKKPSPCRQEIWQLWVKLRQDEPQLLGNLEDFLAKMRRRIQEAKSKKEALEMTLNK